MRIRKDRITNQEKQVSGQAFSKYRKTVAVPIAPLDDSHGAVVYEDVVAWVHRYKALFTARGSVMVLPELLNAYCGVTAGLRRKVVGCRVPITLAAPAVPTTVRSSAMLTGWYGSLVSLTCTEAE